MSGSFGSWFGKSKKKVSQPEPGQRPHAAPKPALETEHQLGAPYKKGDLIGQKYEVHSVLGIGGFGIVYLVYSHETGEVYALKTFLDEFLADQEVRKRFHQEASVWVELGRHPYLVRATFVDEVAGRLYIAMEHIAPNEQGLNSLEGYLRRRPPDLAQSLRWAIQICHGMEYAYSKGVRAHRDLKPANILITQDGTAKITDFGLAGALGASAAMPGIRLSIQQGRIGLSGQTMEGVGFGTPTYMPPEQFENAVGCDQRSDIYSFGIVLYQMAAGGQLPFLAPMPRDGSEQAMVSFWRAMQWLHCQAPVPPLDSPLFPILQRCLEKEPGKRYPTFSELQKDLETLLKHQTGETINPPQLKELEAWEWVNKGKSLLSLGRNEEAIRCYDKALELDPRYVAAWNNKGVSLKSLGRNEEAIRCLDKALELDPRDVYAWNNKGNSLNSLGRNEEAIRCYDQALKLDPRDVSAWNNKGGNLVSLGCYDEALRCLDQALELDPRDPDAWNNKGLSLQSLNRYEEAIRCYDQAMELDPRYINAWNNKGAILESIGRKEEAIRCFDKALEFDPRYVSAWFNKAFFEDELGWRQAATHSYRQFLALASAQYAQQIEHARQRIRELEGN
jgi:tetratricopeptide (TPR) repeat protein